MKTRKILSFVLCLALLLAFVPAVAPTASAATPTTLYLKPNSNWTQASARFAAYYFNNSTGKNAWVSMTDSDGDGIYEAAVPSGYPNVIFCRMNPSASANNWDNKWNQTGDLTIPTDGKNLFTVPSSAWDGSTTSWSTYTYVEPTYTVAGVAELCGTGWDTTNTDNDMTKNADGLYEKVYTNVVAGTHKFKVVMNHSWDNAWGGNVDTDGNTAVTVAENGSTVTILFNSFTKTITTKVVKEYAVSFTGTNVTSDGVATVVKGNTYTATLTAAEGYTLPETVTVTVGGTPVTPTWDASTGVLTVPAVTGDVVITAVGVAAVEQPELEFSAASVEVSEGISINFKVDAALADYYDLESAVATFTYSDHTEDSFEVKNPVQSGEYYVFQLYNIRPDWMGDTVTATLTVELNGEAVTSDPKEYSVATYCYNKLADQTAKTELSTLLVDILNYGAAAQLHTGYKTDALVNKDLGDKAAWGTSAAPTLSGAPVFGSELTDPTADFKGAALFLRETVRIRLSFTAESIEGVTVTATVGGSTHELTSFTDAGNGSYYVFFDGLKVTQMREDVTFTVLQNGTAISNTLTYSVEAYAAVATQTAGTLANMLNAMMNYGDSVAAYPN